MAPMNKKKIAKKTKTETNSPQVSPKLAPAEPEPETRADFIPKPGKPAPRPPADENEQAAATRKAIQMIEKGLKDNPNAQDNGHPWIPKEWPLEMKPILGPYRKFLDKCDHFRVVQGDNPAKFTVHVASSKAKELKDAVKSEAAKWESALRVAWLKYMQDTPKDKRDPEVFVEFAKMVTEEVEKSRTSKDLKKKGKGKKRKLDLKADSSSEPEESEEPVAQTSKQNKPLKKKQKQL